MSIAGNRARPLVGEVAVPHALAVVAVGAAAAASLVVVLGRHFNFVFDEWAFVLDGPSWTAGSLLVPVNEHLVVVEKLLYWPLLRTVGLRDHVPYLVMNAIAHGLTGIALFVLLRRRAGPLPAPLLSLVVLFLGRGADDILLAVQLGFVGSVLCGLVAMILLDAEGAGTLRLVAAAVAMTASLGFSGNGPFYLAAIAVDLLVDPGRRRYLVTLVVPAMLFGAWFVAIGAHASRETITNPYSLSALAALREYVPYGIGAAIAGVFGLSATWTYLVLAAAPAALGLRYALARRRPSTHAVGAAAGLVAMYSVIGSVRYVFGTAESAESRYVYVAAPFVAIIVAEVLRDMPWTRLWRVAIAGVFLAALGLNVLVLLRSAADRDQFFATLENPELAALEAFREAPGIDTNARVDLDTMPRVIVGRYFLAWDAFGPAVPPATTGGLDRLPHDRVDKVVADVFGPTVRTSVAEATATSGCVAGQSDVSLTVPSGADAVLTSTVPGDATVYLGYFDPRNVPAAVSLEVAAGQPVRVHLPDGGPGVRWRVRVVLPKAASGTLCPTSG